MTCTGGPPMLLFFRTKVRTGIGGKGLRIMRIEKIDSSQHELLIDGITMIVIFNKHIR